MKFLSEFLYFEDFEYSSIFKMHELVSIKENKAIKYDSNLERFGIICSSYPSYVTLVVDKCEILLDPSEYDTTYGYMTGMKLQYVEGKFYPYLGEKGVAEVITFAYQMKISFTPNSSHTKIISNIEYGVSCEKCGSFYEYAEKINGFKCWSCKNGW